jgi:hypothetical protein
MGLALGVVDVVYDTGLLGRSVVGVDRDYFMLGDLEGAGISKNANLIFIIGRCSPVKSHDVVSGTGTI